MKKKTFHGAHKGEQYRRSTGKRTRNRQIRIQQLAEARRARKGQVNNPDNPAILEDDPLPVDPPIQEQQPELDVNQPMPPPPPTPIRD